MRQIKIIVEKHEDGYVAYPLGLRGIVVAEGNTYEQVLAEVKSAIQFHLDTFGKDALSDDESPVMEAFIAETGVLA
ncbi:MAG: type II toxin-antitoxin system HicB family antitoxin [Kiritimatiellia bacterium]